MEDGGVANPRGHPRGCQCVDGCRDKAKKEVVQYVLSVEIFNDQVGWE